MESTTSRCLELNEEQLVRFGGTLAVALLSLPAGAVVYLQGDLGAGKTTLVRSVLHRMGVQGPVKSPTYTLLETYPITDRQFHHIDLYRLASPEEMEFLGFDEISSQQDWMFIEWPQMGEGYLPAADLLIQLDFRQEKRAILVSPHSLVGEEIVKKIRP